MTGSMDNHEMSTDEAFELGRSDGRDPTGASNEQRIPDDVFKAYAAGVAQGARERGEDDHEPSGVAECAHCGARVFYDVDAEDYRHLTGPECPLALAAFGYDDEPIIYSVVTLNARNQIAEHEDLTRRQAYELKAELEEAHPGWIVRVRVKRDEHDRAMLDLARRDRAARLSDDELAARERGAAAEPLSAEEVVRLTSSVPTAADELRSVEQEIQRHRDAGTTTDDEYPRLVGHAARLRALVRRDDRTEPVAPRGRYTLVLIDAAGDEVADGDFAWAREVDVADVGSGAAVLALAGELYAQIIDLDVRAMREATSS